MFEEHLAGRSHLDVTTRALEQPRPELPLELRDRLRQGRLRDVQALRGAAEVELLTENGEVAKLSKFERGPVRARVGLS